MKICHIGHGIMPIPPQGWGAVESLIWDYKTYIERAGHDCFVINDAREATIVDEVNRIEPDVVHSHYEQHFPLLSQLHAPVKLMCTHASKPFREENLPILKAFFNEHQSLIDECYICCLSKEMKSYLLNLGISPSQLLLTPNGARADLIRYTKTPDFADRSICLAQVTRRKRQYLFSTLDYVDFVGPKNDPTFDYGLPTYLGEWSRNEVWSNLTRYSNLVLLSSGELAPLVTVQALIAGIGVVVSEAAAANLDVDLPFIDVIPEDKVEDIDYVGHVIRSNQECSSRMRSEIREYGRARFDWSVLVPRYLETLQTLIPNALFQKSSAT